VTSSYAVLKDGTVMAWGVNTAGELGDGTVTNRNRPVFMADEHMEGRLGNALVVSSGLAGTHVIILDNAGKVYGLGGTDANNMRGDRRTSVNPISRPAQLDRESIQAEELIYRLSEGESKNLNVQLKQGINLYGKNRLTIRKPYIYIIRCKYCRSNR
jgi:alpha-tubulin suppressor-like RCC1 family protein